MKTKKLKIKNKSLILIFGLFLVSLGIGVAVSNAISIYPQPLGILGFMLVALLGAIILSTSKK